MLVLAQTTSQITRTSRLTWYWPGCCSPRMTQARHSPLLERLLGTAASQGRTGSVIEIQALRALALAARGDNASALGALTDALTLGRRHGHVRVLADEGAPMHALLAQLGAARPWQQHAAHHPGVGYLAALLRACGQADAVPLRRGATAHRAWPSRLPTAN